MVTTLDRGNNEGTAGSHHATPPPDQAHDREHEIPRSGFTTPRPTGGLVGTALADPTTMVQNLMDLLERHLDGSDGWISRDDDTLVWHFSRLALRISQVNRDGVTELRFDVPMVHDVKEIDEELLSRINDLNAHSAGWCVWIDTERGQTLASSRYPVTQREWWWVWHVLDMVRHLVTIAESNAAELASISDGQIAVAPHPLRGERTSDEEWILQSRTGLLHPGASLDQFYTLLELNELEAGIRFLLADTEVGVSMPLRVEIGAPGEVPSSLMRRAWHPQHGWGWQFLTYGGGHHLSQDPDSFEELLLRAESLNREMANQHPGSPVFGGWVAVTDVGLVHITFMSADTIAKLLMDANAGIGAVMAAIASQVITASTRFVDRDETFTDGCAAMCANAQDFYLMVGRIGWSYTESWNQQPFFSSGQTSTADVFAVPRLWPICNWGIFNPSGPAVDSLELSTDGRLWWLYSVCRHPLAPSVELLGELEFGDFDGLETLIFESVSRTDGPILGGGPDWLVIFNQRFADATINGVQRWAVSQLDTIDFGSRADLLNHYADDPWARVNDTDGEIARSELAESDPLEYWLNTITSPRVIAGHQLFLESAWHGAVSFHSDGPAAAEATMRQRVYSPRDRVMADWEYRGRSGPLLYVPRNEDL